MPVANFTYTSSGLTVTFTNTSTDADGRIIASGSYDQCVRLWDVASGDCLVTLQQHETLIETICFSPDGTLLAYNGANQTVVL